MTGIATWTPAPMLRRLGGDEALARQLVTLFIEECPRMLACLREAVAGGDADAIRRAAHAFKGSVANFTDDAPMTTALELETTARDGEIERAPALLLQIERELDVLTGPLRAFEVSA